MAVPKYDDFYKVILKFIGDGEVHEIKNCRELVKSAMNLTEADIAELKSDGRPKWLARVDWCIITLEKAGMIFYPRQGAVQITAEGKKLSPEEVTTSFLVQRGSPALLDFIKNRKFNESILPLPAEETPEDILESTCKKINAELSEGLLKILLEHSANFFEKFTIKLVEKMGYGIGAETPQSNDGGIDGIIYGDKLGFDRIGIQAKLWSGDKIVGRPEIQKFYGALASSEFGKLDKGLFVTTAKFSSAAQKYAAEQHIILIDGKRLAELTIEFEVGVSTQKVYKFKQLNKDFFDE